MIKENLILSTLIKNVYFRDKTFPYLKSLYFDGDDYSRVFQVLEKLSQNKVTVFDKQTLSTQYSKTDVIDELFEIDFPNENIDYLIRETEAWAKEQALKEAVMASADIIADKKDVNVIDTLIRDALAVSFDKDLGLNYIRDIEQRLERYKENSRQMPTGYRMLDYFTNGGLKTKILFTILGSSGLGKTVALCNLACNLNAAGFQGIYLSLELDRDTIARRMDSINTQIPYFSLLQNKQRVMNWFKTNKGKNTYVKDYPPSKACAINIRTYLKELEIHDKFKPDFLVVDYINLMRPNAQGKNDNMYQIYFEVSKELREIAIEMDIAVLTATQVQREAYGAEHVGLEHARGSMGIMENSDLVIALTQVESQAPENLITWKIVKNRLGRRSGKMETQFDPEILKVNEIITSDDRILLSQSNSGPIIDETKEDELSELSSLIKNNDSSSDSFSDFS